MEHNDTYDAQIEALLAGDYAGFYRLIGWSESEIAEDLELMRGCTVDGMHGHIWASTAIPDGGLFARMPSSTCCASQVEEPCLRRDIDMGGWGEIRDRELAQVVLAGSLFDLQREPGKPRRFSREELQEFARRQRVARAWAGRKP